MPYSPPYPFRAKTEVGLLEPLLDTVRCVFVTPALQRQLPSTALGWVRVTTAPAGTVFSFRTADGTVVATVDNLPLDTLANGAVGVPVLLETGLTSDGGQSRWAFGVVTGSPTQVQATDGRIFAATARAAPVSGGDVPRAPPPGVRRALRLTAVASSGAPWFGEFFESSPVPATRFRGTAALAGVGSIVSGAAVVVEPQPGIDEWVLAFL